MVVFILVRLPCNKEAHTQCILLHSFCIFPYEAHVHSASPPLWLSLTQSLQMFPFPSRDKSPSSSRKHAANFSWSVNLVAPTARSPFQLKLLQSPIQGHMPLTCEHQVDQLCTSNFMLCQLQATVMRTSCWLFPFSLKPPVPRPYTSKSSSRRDTPHCHEWSHQLLWRLDRHALPSPLEPHPAPALSGWVKRKAKGGPR